MFPHSSFPEEFWEEKMILGHPPYTLENERQELQVWGLEDDLPFQLDDS